MANEVQLNLRVPPELKKQIELAAKSNDRSINYEAVRRLEESFGGSIRPTLLTSSPRDIAVSRLKDELERLRNEMASLAKVADELSSKPIEPYAPKTKPPKGEDFT